MMASLSSAALWRPAALLVALATTNAKVAITATKDNAWRTML